MTKKDLNKSNQIATTLVLGEAYLKYSYAGPDCVIYDIRPNEFGVTREFAEEVAGKLNVKLYAAGLRPDHIDVCDELGQVRPFLVVCF